MKILLISLILTTLFTTSCIRDIKVQDEPTINDITVEQTNTDDETVDISESEWDATETVTPLTQSDVEVSTWVPGLDTPWSLVFLDDSRALVTERNGRVSLIMDGNKQESMYWSAPSTEYGEWGLMGIEKDPDYEDNKLIYVMYTYQTGDEAYMSRVVQLVDWGQSAEFVWTIIDEIPAAKYHNGGRIKFWPDGKLYVTTGDALEPNLSQDMDSLAGKILRVNTDGSIPEDNPFPDSLIYTLWHRNPQWITWNPVTGDGFLSTHGPSGEFFLTARDRIDALTGWWNYGRPIVAGYSDEYIDPIAYYPEKATPPAGMTFWNGTLFVATLKSEALLSLNTQKIWDTWNIPSQSRWFEWTYGRLRDAVVWPDGNMYILTSNADGKWDVGPWGDMILVVKRK